MKRIVILLNLFFALPIYAKTAPGKAHYQANCMACHGEEGQGGVNFSAPPLAESLWVQGDPTLAIKIVLNGLKGNIDVGGHTYTSLMMPPHGATLNDDQIAEVLSYVRSNWNNESSEVTPAQVAEVRKEIKGMAPFFEADELLKKHPLPPMKTALRDLLMETFVGKWKKLPDFSKLKSEGLEEEHSNIISFKNISHKTNFGVVWEGKLEVKKKGLHKFIVKADDGVKLMINGESVAKLENLGPMSRSAKGNYRFEAGLHDIRVEYFQGGGGKGLSIRWSGPSVPKGAFLSDRVKDAAPASKRIPLVPNGSEAFIYRNFIKGVSPRAIGVGYPGGMSIAFSQDDCSMDLMWKSGFLDGGLHWTGRGQGETEPVGDGLVTFVSGKAFGLDVNFLRMEHDEHRFPAFIYQAGDYLVKDRPEPLKNGIKRVLTIKAETAGKVVYRYHPSAIRIVDIVCKEVPKASFAEIPMELKPGLNTFNLFYTYK